MKHISTFTTLAALACMACGDNGGAAAIDATVTDATVTDVDAASIDAAPPIDAGPPIDAAPFTPPTPFGVPLSATGPDQLQSAAPGPGGTFYAAGYAATTPTGTRLVTVVQFSPTGPVNSFGAGGVATTTLDFRGGADEIDLALQSTGKLIVTATVANATNPADRDIAVARLTTAGALDPTFGVGGVRILDLSTAHDNAGTLVGFDGVRDVAVGAGDEIYVHGYSRATGTTSGGTPRTDTDLTVVKLDANGTVDATFAGDGSFNLDLQQVSESTRGIAVLADGNLLAVGYANTPGLGSVQPVMYKLTPAGALVPGFANGGVFHDVVLALQTEVYNVAVHGTQVVTAGYGRATGTQNDWVSLRFDLATGARDATWGGSGAVVLDPSGTMVGDNCRNAIALPGGKTALVGSSGPGNMPAQDAAFAILDSTGALDTSYGDGVYTLPLGSNGADQFWGAAVSGGNLVLVGYRGAGTTQTDTNNDDSFGAIIPLR